MDPECTNECNPMSLPNRRPLFALHRWHRRHVMYGACRSLPCSCASKDIWNPVCTPAHTFMYELCGLQFILIHLIISSNSSDHEPLAAMVSGVIGCLSQQLALNDNTGQIWNSPYLIVAADCWWQFLVQALLVVLLRLLLAAPLFITKCFQHCCTMPTLN